MSQFLLVWGEEPDLMGIDNVCLVPLGSCQPLVKECAKHYKIDNDHTRLVAANSGNTSDEIFSDASYRLGVGDKFSYSRLGQVINRLLKKRCLLIAWCSNDYADLPCVDGIVDLIELVHEELPIGSGDMYFRYATYGF